MAASNGAARAATTAEREPVSPPLQGESGGAPDLDALIHERMRLGIVSALAVHDTLSFTELRALLGASDGNLSVHARRLEAGGYVESAKVRDDRVARTDYRLTSLGRAALTRYLDHMEALIRATRAG